MLMTLYSSILTCIIAYDSIDVIIVQSTYTLPKFIRSISYNAICNDLIGLLELHRH